MSSPDLDLEKQPMVSVTPLSPDSSKRLSALDTYQLLVGNIDKPVDVNDDSLYHAVVAEERKSKYLYILSGKSIVMQCYYQHTQLPHGLDQSSS